MFKKPVLLNAALIVLTGFLAYNLWQTWLYSATDTNADLKVEKVKSQKLT